MDSRIISRGRRVAATAALLVAAIPATAAASARSHAAAPTAPPPVTVLSNGHNLNPDDVFITPTNDTAQTQAEYANGAEILNRAGKKVWWHAAPAGDTDADLRVQRYQGKPVLTYWEGTGLGGLSNGTDYILNQNYKTIATVTTALISTI